MGSNIILPGGQCKAGARLPFAFRLPDCLWGVQSSGANNHRRICAIDIFICAIDYNSDVGRASHNNSRSGGFERVAYIDRRARAG